MADVTNRWRQRAQAWAVRRARSSRLWPVGTADKRADAGRIGKPVAASVLVFFATGQDTLYQLRGWLRALEALSEVHPVVVVFRDSRAAARIRAESSLDCLTLASVAQLDAVLGVSDVKLALYVSHDPMNFECLRFTSLVHVYLGHGDSDKGVSVSNQVKAYDFCFLAGQGALDRTIAGTMLYDAQARSVLVGQPQLDEPPCEPHPDPARATVLYAPTWEGSQPSMCYSSVLTMGARVLAALRGTYRVIYRPHPRTGALDPRYAAADAALRASADRVDVGVPLSRSFADADLLVADVSAVVLAWLPTGKPVLVTEASVPEVASPAMDALPRLTADADLARLVADQLRDDAAAPKRRALAEYYFGDTSPGAAIRRFVAACDEAIALRDEQWTAARARGATAP